MKTQYQSAEGLKTKDELTSIKMLMKINIIVNRHSSDIVLQPIKQSYSMHSLNMVRNLSIDSSLNGKIEMFA